MFLDSFLITPSCAKTKRVFKVLGIKMDGAWWGLKVGGNPGGEIRGNKLVSDNFSQSSLEGIVTIPIVTNYVSNNRGAYFLIK